MHSKKPIHIVCRMSYLKYRFPQLSTRFELFIHPQYISRVSRRNTSAVGSTRQEVVPPANSDASPFATDATALFMTEMREIQESHNEIGSHLLELDLQTFHMNVLRTNYMVAELQDLMPTAKCQNHISKYD